MFGAAIEFAKAKWNWVVEFVWNNSAKAWELVVIGYDWLKGFGVSAFDMIVGWFTWNKKAEA